MTAVPKPNPVEIQTTVAWFMQRNRRLPIRELRRAVSDRMKITLGMDDVARHRARWLQMHPAVIQDLAETPERLKAQQKAIADIENWALENAGADLDDFIEACKGSDEKLTTQMALSLVAQEEVVDILRLAADAAGKPYGRKGQRVIVRPVMPSAAPQTQQPIPPPPPPPGAPQPVLAAKKSSRAGRPLISDQEVRQRIRSALKGEARTSKDLFAHVQGDVNRVRKVLDAMVKERLVTRTRSGRQVFFGMPAGAVVTTPRPGMPPKVLPVHPAFKDDPVGAQAQLAREEGAIARVRAAADSLRAPVRDPEPVPAPAAPGNADRAELLIRAAKEGLKVRLLPDGTLEVTR